MIAFVYVKSGAKVEYVKKVSESSFTTPYQLAHKADEYLECSVRAPRERGRANERLIEILARYYDIKKTAVFIKKGVTSTYKMIEIL